MAVIPNRLPLVCFLFFALFLVSGASSLRFEQLGPQEKSPEEFLRRCYAHCPRREGESQQVCHRQCEEEYRWRKEREHGDDELGDDSWAVKANPRKDPREQYLECLQQCQRWSRGVRKLQACENHCDEKFREQEERERHGGNSWTNQERRGGKEEEEEEEEVPGQGSPYILKGRHFITKTHQHGKIRFLPKLTERSPLLRGVENYRVSILQAEPETFIVPKHADADYIIAVDWGIAYNFHLRLHILACFSYIFIDQIINLLVFTNYASIIFYSPVSILVGMILKCGC